MLLEEEYINNRTPMRCSCKVHEDVGLEITLNTAENGISSCYLCNSQARNTLESARDIFYKNGYELLSDVYVNNKYPMKSRCLNHPDNLIFISVDGVLKGSKRCRYCNKYSRLNIDLAREMFNSNGLTLLEKTYKNGTVKMKFLCNKHLDYIQYDNISNLLKYKNLCKYCRTIRKWDIDSAIKEFESNGLLLLEDKFVSSSAYMKYRCKKHPNEIRKTKLAYILHGSATCSDCIREARSGSKNNNWKGGIASITHLLRTRTHEWKRNIMKISDYVCDISGEKAEDVHHLNSFRAIVDDFLLPRGIKDFEDFVKMGEKEKQHIMNEFRLYHDSVAKGVALKYEIHKLFHNRYGQFNNTEEQYLEFKNNYLKENDI